MKLINANKPWTDDHHDKLAKLWNKGASLDTMSIMLGRSCASICAILATRGYLYWSSARNAYIEANTPAYATMKTIRDFDNEIKEM